MRSKTSRATILGLIGLVGLLAVSLGAQAPAAPAAAGVGPPPQPAAAAPGTPATPSDYLIGPDDLLSVVFWRDKDMTSDVVVRPDGKISLPVINEIQAAGLTPDQLRAAILTEAAKFFVDPSVNVIVKQINSKKAFVTGEVAKPGPYAITGKMTVLQLIAMAGGLNEYAKRDNIGVFRTENGQPKRYKVNYNDLLNGKNLKQNNIEILAGDTVVVP